MNSRPGIDIIIPVYNAFQELRLCVESLKRHTDLSIDRIIFVEDKSTDERVLPYLRSLTGPGVVLLENEMNLGFSGSVNRGIGFSDRDILLLNSDTIVTARWLEKIIACAYSDKTIGTVTPFSNNATLCSVPNFCEDNTLPDGLSIDVYARIIERCSWRAYPQIPIAVGFCMFIKREVIDTVGYFDQETFQRGYGEENDFCFRAEQLGYRNVLCDDTYIYHSGTSSFLSKEKTKLIQEHEKTLEKRYPAQVWRNAEYIRNNPHQYLRDNIAIYTKLANGRKNILFVIHADFRADADDHIGGTQFHVKDLMTGLRRQYNVFVAARDGEYLRLTVYLETDRLSFKFFIGPRPLFPKFNDTNLTKLFENVLQAFPIDLVHIHHTKDISFDIFHITKKIGLPLVATLHDYYYICPTTLLLEKGEIYCHGEGNCAACLEKQLGHRARADYIRIWRKKCQEGLALCDALILPSDAAKDIYVQQYPELQEKMRVIPHGAEISKHIDPVVEDSASTGFEYHIDSVFEEDHAICGWAFQPGCINQEAEIYLQIEDVDGKKRVYKALSVIRADVANAKQSDAYRNSGFKVYVPDSYFTSGSLVVRPLIHSGGTWYAGNASVVKGYNRRKKEKKRIAFIGGLNKSKGSQFACRMVKQSSVKYDWYIFGGIGDAKLLALEKKNLYKADWYQRERITEILQENQIDLVCILPIWPETFCYTLSEAVLAGVPVLATDIGAVGERVKKDYLGWLIQPTDSPKDALAQIDEIFQNEDEYMRISQHVAEFSHKSAAEMDDEYAALYRNMIPRGSLWTGTDNYDQVVIYQAYAKCNMGAALSSGTDLALYQRVNELENRISSITGSVGYRMVRFLARHNFPFKRQLKKLLLLGYGLYKKAKK